MICVVQFKIYKFFQITQRDGYYEKRYQQRELYFVLYRFSNDVQDTNVTEMGNKRRTSY